MRLKIISDGTARGSAIYSEDGQLIEGVVAISWSIGRADEEAIATVDLINIPVDISIPEENVERNKVDTSRRE